MNYLKTPLTKRGQSTTKSKVTLRGDFLIYLTPKWCSIAYDKNCTRYRRSSGEYDGQRSAESGSAFWI